MIVEFWETTQAATITRQNPHAKIMKILSTVGNSEQGRAVFHPTLIECVEFSGAYATTQLTTMIRRNIRIYAGNLARETHYVCKAINLSELQPVTVNGVIKF